MIRSWVSRCAFQPTRSRSDLRIATSYRPSGVLMSAGPTLLHTFKISMGFLSRSLFTHLITRLIALYRTHYPFA